MTLDLTLDIASWILLMAGSGFVLTGGLGLFRLPDFYTRLHASGIVDTLGAGLIVAGLMLQSGFTQVTAKLLLILVFLFFTSPTATHAVAHAAVAGKLKPWRRDAGPEEPREPEEETEQADR